MSDRENKGSDELKRKSKIHKKGHPFRCPIVPERMTGLARLRSRLPTRPRPFKQFTGLFEFAYGEPAFSSPPHCKTKRTPKRCPFILERMTGLEPATSTLARWRSTRCATSANGAFGRNRTNDTRIFSPLLYQLSYKGKKKNGDPERARTVDL